MAISDINGLSKEEMIKVLTERNIVPEGTLSSMREQARSFNKNLKEGDTSDINIGGDNSGSTQNTTTGNNNITNFEKPTTVTNNYYQSVITSSSSVHSWGLKFSGSTDVRDFILRIEEISRSRNVELSSVVTSFSDLLEGRALAWYRTIFDDSLTWSTLKKILIARFDVCTNQTEALKALFAMKQKFSQAIVEYVEDVQLANLRLDVPLSEEQLVDLVCDSLQPKYALAIAYFSEKSLSALVSVCTKFDKLSVDKPVPHFNASPKPNFSKSSYSSYSNRAHYSQQPCPPQAQGSHTPRGSSNQASFSPRASSSNSSFNSKKTFNCFYCKEQGHTKKYCEKWKKDSLNQNAAHKFNSKN